MHQLVHTLVHTHTLLHSCVSSSLAHSHPHSPAPQTPTNPPNDTHAQLAQCRVHRMGCASTAPSHSLAAPTPQKWPHAHVEWDAIAFTQPCNLAHTHTHTHHSVEFHTCRLTGGVCQRATLPRAMPTRSHTWPPSLLHSTCASNSPLWCGGGVQGVDRPRNKPNRAEMAKKTHAHTHTHTCFESDAT
jgi:hypothetical protein